NSLAQRSLNNAIGPAFEYGRAAYFGSTLIGGRRIRSTIGRRDRLIACAWRIADFRAFLRISRSCYDCAVRDLAILLCTWSRLSFGWLGPVASTPWWPNRCSSSSSW